MNSECAPCSFSPDLFDGCSALVTGGTSGIGLAIASALADHGCQVIVTGLTRTECDGCLGVDPRLSPRELDVRDEGQVQLIVESLSSLDILINAAGMIGRDGIEHSIEGFETTLAVNLTGTARVCYACHDLLSASTQGCVVNVASMLSYFGSGFVPAYSASKGGIAQLTRSLAIAWAEDGVRVNAVAPGWVETELTRPLSEDEGRSQQILDRTPMKRWGHPSDISGPALFLCSPAAGFMTGAIIPVDGGYSAC